MNIVRATALGLFLAGIVTIAAVPAGAGPLPASIATVKASAPTDLAQARWWGWRGGWGWNRGWGYPGAFVDGAPVGPYPYYGDGPYYPGYAYCGPYAYCGSYGYYGSPYHGGYGAGYSGPYWWRRW